MPTAAPHHGRVHTFPMVALYDSLPLADLIRQLVQLERRRPPNGYSPRVAQHYKQLEDRVAELVTMPGVPDGEPIRCCLEMSVRAPDDRLAVGTSAMIAIRAAAVTVEANSSADGVNSAECEIVFVEFLGDLVKLHLLAGGERMLAKVAAEHYPALRGREGERIRISWKEEDVQLLDA